MNQELYSDDRIQAVAVIESLRAGIPTRASTRQLPDLRPTLREVIGQDLEKFAAGKTPPKGRLIWGQYGQGKTHALTTIEHMALDRGFAVSRISLSREVSLHNLFQFYRRIAPIVRLPNSHVPGILGALQKCDPKDLPLSTLSQEYRYIHPWPAIVLEDLLRVDGEEQHKLYSDLMGLRLPVAELRRIHRETRHENLPGFSESFKRSVHASAYLGVLADIVQFCGYTGWVILIDEAELIGRLGRLTRMKAYANLSMLLQWTGKIRYPFYTVTTVASRLQDDLWHGEIGSRRNDPDWMVALAENEPDREKAQTLERFFKMALDPDQCPIIRPVQKDDLIRLLETLKSMHAVGYAWEPTLAVETVVQKIGDQPVRTHIRATLEALDLSLVSGETVVPEAAELVETTMEEDENDLAVDPPEDHEETDTSALAD